MTTHKQDRGVAYGHWICDLLNGLKIVKPAALTSLKQTLGFIFYVAFYSFADLRHFSLSLSVTWAEHTHFAQVSNGTYSNPGL
jgi:hypothetical protein